MWALQINKTNSKVNDADKFPSLLQFLPEQKRAIEYDNDKIRMQNNIYGGANYLEQMDIRYMIVMKMIYIELIITMAEIITRMLIIMMIITIKIMEIIIKSMEEPIMLNKIDKMSIIF